MAFKKNKAKMIGVVTSIAAASLVSVGFAAWSIANVKTDDVQSNITVNTGVSLNILSFADKETSAKSFTFGKSAGAAIANAWLLTDFANPDSLGPSTFTWDYTVRKGYTPSATAVIKTGEGATDGNNAWDAAVTAGWVQVKTLTASVGTLDTTSSQEYDSGVLTVTVELQWGTHFGGKNPYEFYNTEKKQTDYVNGTSGPTWSDDAIASLNSATFKAISSIALTIDVTLS